MYKWRTLVSCADDEHEAGRVKLGIKAKGRKIDEQREDLLVLREEHIAYNADFHPQKGYLRAQKQLLLGQVPFIFDDLAWSDPGSPLAKITAAYIAVGLTEEELNEPLESERDVFEVWVAMVRVSSKATIQKAINAALGVLMTAVV